MNWKNESKTRQAKNSQAKKSDEMDEIEFRKRVYANPSRPEQDVLNAAQENPAYQQILDQSQEFETDMASLLRDVEIPQGLADKLLALPTQADRGTTAANLADRSAANSSLFQYYAIAATLVMAVGVTISLTFNSGLSTADLALGNEVIEHLYLEEAEINAITQGIDSSILAMPAVNIAMQDSGTRLVNSEFLQEIPIRFAMPCTILPAYQSAHLIIQGSRGAVSVIIINNSPVSVEYRIRDERFAGVVVPMESGNMILVGESNEDLDQYRDLFSNNVDWII